MSATTRAKQHVELCGYLVGSLDFNVLVETGQISIGPTIKLWQRGQQQQSEVREDVQNSRE